MTPPGQHPADDDEGGQVVSEIGPWAMVPVWVLTKKLAPAEMCTYISLRSFADKGGGAYPTAQKIAKRANLALGTTRNAIQGLRKKGLLETTEWYRADGSLGGLNYKLYDIDPAPIETPEPRRKGEPGGKKASSDRGTPTDVPPSTEPENAPLDTGAGYPTGVGGLHQLVQGDAPVDVGKEHTREHTKEHTKTKNPPAAADAETDSRLAQTTIDGTEEPIKSGAREETDEDRAFGIANGWVGYRRQQGVPVAPANRAVHLIKSLSLPFLATGYTVNEIKNALARIGEGVPSKGQLQRELERGRTGRGNGGAVRQGRRSGADVESSWADVRPAKSDAAPAFADSSSGGSRW